MTIEELFNLPIGSRVLWNDPFWERLEAEVVAKSADELTLRWDDDEEYIVGRDNNEDADMLAWLSVLEAPVDDPVIVSANR